VLPLIAGLSLIAVELVRSVPAVLRVHQTRSVDGLSDVSLGVLLGTAPGWIALGYLAEAPWIAIACAIWGALHAILCWQAASFRPLGRRRLVGSAAATCSVIAVGTWLGAAIGGCAAVLGMLVAASSLVHGIPSLVVGMTSATTSGLSRLSLAVNSTEGTLYLLSGLGFGWLAPEGQFVLGFAAFGALSIAYNGPRLLRTVYRRSKGLDDVQAAW
jgi:hypothetical protein